MADSRDEEIIELTQVLDQDDSQDQDVIELTQLADPGALSLGLDDRERVVADLPEGLERISQEQLDAALERVIQKKFAQRIETILFEVTERVIKQEIADIKAGLQKDLDDINNA